MDSPEVPKRTFTKREARLILGLLLILQLLILGISALLPYLSPNNCCLK